MTVASAGLLTVPHGIDPERLLAGVAAAERERYRALRRPRRAWQYLASRWLLRRHLAGELGLQPADIALRNNTDGPPTLPGTRYRLGLSHSGAVALCITSTQARVGCDVEYHQPRHHVHDIAAQFFHPAEAAHLARLTDDHAYRAFHRLWTLKEAAQKALGHGITGGLHSPAFVLEPSLRCIDAPPGPSWTFASCPLGDTADCYTLALAIADSAPPARFTVHEYSAATGGAVCRRDLRWEMATVHGNAGQ